MVFWVPLKPRARISREIPWGWYVDPEDSRVLKPIQEQLETLAKAKLLVKTGVSLRDAATWLSAVTGKYLSHVGLMKQMKKEQLAERRRAWDLGVRRKAEKELADGATEHSPASTETQ